MPHLMSPRCSVTKVRISSLFSLHLWHENPLYRFWKPFAGAGHCRHLPAAAAHHAFPAAGGRALLPRFAAPVPLAVTAKAAGALHPQLPRTQVHISPCQNHLRQPDVAHHPLLCHFPVATGMAQGTVAGHSRGRDVAHPVV